MSAGMCGKTFINSFARGELEKLLRRFILTSSTCSDKIRRSKGEGKDSILLRTSGAECSSISLEKSLRRDLIAEFASLADGHLSNLFPHHDVVNKKTSMSSPLHPLLAPAWTFTLEIRPSWEELHSPPEVSSLKLLFFGWFICSLSSSSSFSCLCFSSSFHLSCSIRF